MKYTVTEFRKNIREILDAVDHGAEVMIVRYDKEYLISNHLETTAVIGIDPDLVPEGANDTPILKEVRKNANAAMNLAREKQADLLTHDIVSKVDMKVENDKIVATVTPDKEATKQYIKDKYSADKKMKVPHGVIPVESCPHGYAKGFCKKVDCNKKYQK